MDNPAPIGGRPGRTVSRRYRPGPAADGTLRPPLTARSVLLSAGLMTVLLAVIVLVVVHPPGPLDERTLADQRNGLLRNGPVLPSSVSGVDFGTEPVVLLFLRHARPCRRSNLRGGANAAGAAASRRPDRCAT